MAPPRVTHLLPEDDVIAHEPSDCCICGPWRLPAQPDAGQREFVVIHPRLDGKAPPAPS